MIDIPDDIPKYRKRSTRKPPKKSKHKHTYKECLLKVKLNIKYNTGDKMAYSIYVSEYCTICGKIGKSKMLETKRDEEHNFMRRVLTNDEIIEKYKHLETFEIDDVFDKYVTLSDVANDK